MSILTAEGAKPEHHHKYWMLAVNAEAAFWGARGHLCGVSGYRG
jgi:hypothetical protein